MITKECPGCGMTQGRTQRVCKGCRHAFIPKRGRQRLAVARDTDAEKFAKAAEKLLTVKAKPQPRTRPVSAPKRVHAQADERAIDEQFYSNETPTGGLLMCWPEWGVSFALTKIERERVAAALAAR